MTHAHNSSPQSATTRMVMQYGHRDEDDDDDSAYDSDEERHKSLFGGMMMMHNRRGSQERKGMVGGLGGALQNLGASMTFGHASGDDDDDSDDESVGSITAKAKQVFKNFGDSISSGIKLAKKKKKKRRNSNDDDEEEEESDSDSDSDEEESGSEEEEEDDDDSDSDDESDMDDDRSVASRTAKAVRKVTGKIGQALSLGRRSDDESDEDEDDDSDEEEEDPLQTHNNNNNKRSGSRGILPRLTSSFGSGSGVGNPRAKDVLLMQQDGSHGSQGSNSGRNGRRRRSNERTPLRRSHTADETHPHHHGATAAPFHRCQTTESRNQYAKAAAKVLAQEAYVEPAQAVWSMNVTEQMLEQATNEGIYVPPAANQPQPQPQQQRQQQKSKLRA